MVNEGTLEVEVTATSPGVAQESEKSGDTEKFAVPAGTVSLSHTLFTVRQSATGSRSLSIGKPIE